MKVGLQDIALAKKIKMFQWDEIRTLACTSESLFTGWCYISNENKKFNYSGITKMRLDKDVIYFHLSKKAVHAIKTYSKNVTMIEELFDKTNLE